MSRGLGDVYKRQVLAVVVGMFQGGIQALSRSHFAKIIPPEKSGEYFGLFDICGKGASFLGTMIVSVGSQLTGSANVGVGSIAVLFAVVVLCVAIFGVLTVSSAVSDRRAAERYGEHVEVLYACENAGQDWLSEADAYLKGAGDLPENTEETETTLKTEIKRGNMQLEICLNKINGSYEIAKWRCTSRWQPDDSLNLG